MKLHDLRPAEGSHKARTRVGRGIAAGKGKTAGRGTKGQKARAGGSIPPWFEGGQTPLHQRIPKLRGFTNRAKVQFEVVNVGAIAQRVEAGAFAEAGTAPKKGEQLTINADILRAVGLVRDVRKPLKILGAGELSAALFVVADAFTKSAMQKIEAAGGVVSVLEVPAVPRPALGVDGDGARPVRERRTAAGRADAVRTAEARAQRTADATERAAEATASSAAKSARAERTEAAPTRGNTTEGSPSRKRSSKAADAAEEATPTATTDAPAVAPASTEPTGAAAEAAVDAADAVDATDGPSATGAPEAARTGTAEPAAKATESNPAADAPATEPTTEADADSEAAADESA